MNILPQGWRIVFLSDVADHALGKMLDRQKHTRGAELPYLRNINVQWGRIDTGDVLEMYFEEAEVDRYGLREGDLLVCEGGEPGRCAIWDGRDANMRFQKALHRVRPSEALIPAFLRYHLAHDAASGGLDKYFSGTTIKHFTGRSLGRYEVRLPTPVQQRHIVEKIEALTAKSGRAKEALDAIPPLLERFRQSVLAAAFRGDLTKDWREQNPDVEPADQLLARIRQERRARWEQAELEKLRAKGKPPKNDDWKKKYVEPEPVDAEGLPELPGGWCRVTAEEISWDVTVGHVGPMQMEYCESGVPFLRSQNVRENRFDPGGLCYISVEFHRKLSKSRLKPGDVVIVRSGAPGTACVVPDELLDANCSDLVIVRLLPGMQPPLLAYFMNSHEARAGVRGVQVGVAQQHFNVGSMKRTAVPLMPVAEQRELLSRIGAGFKACASLEARVSDAERIAASLDSSILAKAFRGELVALVDDKGARQAP